MTDESADAGGNRHRAQARILSGAGTALPATAADARALVEEQIASHAPGLQCTEAGVRVMADALLVTSELVTNAIRHGGGLTAFDLLTTGGELVLNVADASTRLPVTTYPAGRESHQTGGFGWPLVCHLAEHVAVIPLPDGKQITILISLTPQAP
ncbi:ATP-binding protein [Streptomyces microflavus]|uniref:ATP-binding protein n=1 Tax=Streptomyces TaxID=1883 RepID=UPI002E160445|nr:ATP-binding protein [Streptomyces microflavus]